MKNHPCHFSSLSDNFHAILSEKIGQVYSPCCSVTEGGVVYVLICQNVYVINTV